MEENACGGAWGGQRWQDHLSQSYYVQPQCKDWSIFVTAFLPHKPQGAWMTLSPLLADEETEAGRRKQT